MPTRIKQIIAGLLVAIFLCACGSRPGAGPANLLPTFTPTRTDGFYTDTSGPGATETLSPTPNPFVTGTSTATITRTPTIDYSAPGVPSATPTPTLDYVRLAAQNLTPDTPWPTWTGYPPASATANVADILSKVAIRKITPQPPPGLNRTNYAGLLPGLVQSATDLMNATNGNQELYLKTIQSWAPNAMAYSPDDWFLETDFDHDGQPEWLVGMPTASADGRIRCGDPGPVNCYRAFFLFEKIGDGYRPMHILLPAFTDEEAGTSKITLVRDLNNNHMPEIVFRADVCGSNCYTFLRIGEWDGYIWREYRFSAEGSKVTFADRDGNGTIEIALEYSTGGASQYNHPYPFMHGLVDVYGWTNGRFGLISQIRPPTDSVFAVIHDIDQALQFRNP